MRSGRLTLMAGLLWVLASAAGADDVTIELDATDELIIRDSTSTDKINLDPDLGAVKTRRVVVDPVDHLFSQHVAAVSIGVDGGLDHGMAVYRRDNGNKLAFLFTGGGGLRSNGSVTIDGKVDGTVNPLTGKLAGLDHAPIADPDNPGNNIPSMLQIGNDVEFNLMLRANTNSFPNGGALVVVDSETDFRFQIDAQGRLMFGPDGEPSRAALDVILERADNGANDHLMLTTEGGDVIELLQQAHVSDPAGGSTVDVECRTAVNQILDLLEGNGLMAQ